MRLSVAERAGAAIAGAAVTALMKSTRSTLIAGEEVERTIVAAGSPAIYLLWHGRLLPCSWRYRHRGFGTLITRNRDGELVKRMFEGWGYHVVRGSSSRGGEAASREIIRLLREGSPVALTPDGPRGPMRSMKVGPLKIAQAAGVPIVPVSAAASRGREFGKWDRFTVPAPFAWCPCALGDPIEVASEATGEEIEAIRIHVEDALNRLTDLTDRAARED